MLRISLMHVAYFVEPEKLVSKAAELGFDGVEFFTYRALHSSPLDLDKNARKRLKELVQSKGLEIANIAASTDLTDPQRREKELIAYKAYVELARDLDASLIRATHGELRTGVPYEKQFRSVVESLKECAKMAEDAGIPIALDNHFFCSLEENVRIIKEVGREMKLSIDCGNAAAMGDDYVGLVRKYPKLIVHTHIKDFKRVFGAPPWAPVEGGLRVFVPIGDGDVDIRGFVNALKEGGYNGFLSIEHEAEERFVSPEASDRAVKKGLAYLRKLI